MVALAMIEVGGMTPEDAVLAIREKRRGAINTKYVLKWEVLGTETFGCCVALYFLRWVAFYGLCR